MKYKTKKQYRLPGFDFSGPGEYFVTICIHQRKHFFGEIEYGSMVLSNIGAMAEKIFFNNFNK
jgi:REP-associated tyrosine transposase